MIPDHYRSWLSKLIRRISPSDRWLAAGSTGGQIEGAAKRRWPVAMPIMVATTERLQWVAFRPPLQAFYACLKHIKLGS